MQSEIKKNKAMTNPISLMIGAPTSGSGKTTITMGLMRALSDRGLRVQPFKCGPDYIDTLFHQLATGCESVNLDTFMASESHVRALFSRYGGAANVCVAEGAMGLYDGYDRWHGSAASIARLLKMPVVLVVDAKAVGYSVAALLHGFKTFTPTVTLAGVVMNRVSSVSHAQFLRVACDDVGVHCLGCLPNNPQLSMPSRHLGLSLSERQTMERFVSLAAREVEEHVDIDALLRVVQPLSPSLDVLEEPEDSLVNDNSSLSLGSTIAIARDEAFNFTYRANIDALKKKGKCVFFSPLHDAVLPPCDSLYLPGGYPELYAAELAAGESMKASIRAFAEGGGSVLAECGGFMYLCEAIDEYRMCGVLPLRATMEGARLHLGYRQMEWEGRTLRGHEFHYSSVCEPAVLPLDVQRLVLQSSASGKPVATPLYRYKRVTAGYTHWYWASL